MAQRWAASSVPQPGISSKALLISSCSAQLQAQRLQQQLDQVVQERDEHCNRAGLLQGLVAARVHAQTEPPVRACLALCSST